MTVVAAQEKITIGPQPGPQTAFLESTADICIYGGQAGSGKSYALVLDQLRWTGIPGYAGIIFRRTSPELEGSGSIWEEATALFQPFGAALRGGNSKRARFPSGSLIEFRHLQLEKDKTSHQGKQYAVVSFDEVTHFTESQFWYLFGRVRSISGIQGYMRGTCNPDADSWLRKFLDWWIDPKTGLAIPERSGVLRWFVRDPNDDTLVWSTDKDDLPIVRGAAPKSATFISATLEDNPALTARDPGYSGRLEAMPRRDRERLRGGNWNIGNDEGNEWPSEYFTDSIYFDDWPSKENTQIKVVALDPSLGRTDKSDYSAFVCVVKDRQHNYYIDADLARRPSSKIVEAGMGLFEYWRPEAFGCESNQFQELLRAEFEEQLMRASSPVRVYGIHNTQNKMLRIRLLTRLLASGRLKFKRGSAGVELLISQLRGFPHHQHDDGCFAAGTMIETSEGPKAIEEVKPGELVLTRQGYSQVLLSGCTGVRDTITLRTSSGNTLTGTADHPIFDGIAFVPMHKITRVSTCHASTKQRSLRQLSLMGSRFGVIRRPSSGRIGCTTRPTLAIAGPGLGLSIKRYGSQSTAQSQSTIKYITSTGTNSITQSKTWAALQKRNMTDCTQKPVAGGAYPQPVRHNSTQQGYSPLNGMAAKQAGRGIENTARMYGKTESQLASNAAIVVEPMRRSSRIVRSSAHQNAGNGRIPQMVDMQSETVCDVKRSKTQPVFNLTVDGESEYFANGILVHNCDALEMGVRLADELLTGVPQAIAERMGNNERAIP